MYEGHWFGGGFMWLFWILFIVVMIWVLNTVAGGVKRSEKTESALDILKARYARGEIEREEYEQKRKDLMG